MLKFISFVSGARIISIGSMILQLY